jgi:hypothetical protein
VTIVGARLAEFDAVSSKLDRGSATGPLWHGQDRGTLTP